MVALAAVHTVSVHDAHHLMEEKDDRQFGGFHLPTTKKPNSGPGGPNASSSSSWSSVVGTGTGIAIPIELVGVAVGVGVQTGKVLGGKREAH